MKCQGSDDNAQNKRKLRALLATGIFLIILPVVSFVVDPQYQLMLYMTRVSEGSEIYEILLRENAATLLHVYVFNITNAEAFLSGEDQKLRVEEVGPFTYQEYRKNEEFEVDEEAGVMRYRPIIRTTFIPELSIADPKQVKVVVPNAAMLAITSKLSSYSFWIKSAFNLLVNRLNSTPIVETTAHDFLWGYNEPLIELSNTVMPGWISFTKMGVMDRLYDQSSIPLLEVSIATEDKFQVKSIDGVTGLNFWNYENPSKRTRCNSFVDTYEGFAYPPRLTRDDPLRLYRSAFCRIIDLNYIGTTTTDISPEAYIYEISNKSYSIDPSTECLCGLEYECIDGVSTISPCMLDLSIALSNAHFLYADPKTYERVEGIHPDKEEHGSEFVVDPSVGAVLSGRFTLQANVIVKDVSFNSQVNPFSNMVVPLVYFKITQPDLPEDNRNNIRKSHYLYPYIFHGIEIIMLMAGLSLLVYVLLEMSLNCLRSRHQKNEAMNKRVQRPLMEENFKDFEIGKSQLEIYSLDS